MPEKLNLKLKLIVSITKLDQKVVKLIQTPQEKGELSQFRRMNSPEALVLTVITNTPPFGAKPGTSRWVSECDIKYSVKLNPPTPTVYTVIHTVGPEVNCKEQGHRKSPSSGQRLSDIAGICLAAGVGWWTQEGSPRPRTPLPQGKLGILWLGASLLSSETISQVDQ